MFNHAWLLCVGLVLAGGPARADDPGEADCLGMPTLRDDASVTPILNTVAPGRGKVHFVATKEGCPSPDRSCILPVFVMPGDPVIVTGTYGGYACATFTGPAPRTASTSGWLLQDALAEAAPAVPGLTAWAGRWRMENGADIDIVPAENGKVAIRGQIGDAGSTASGMLAATAAPTDGLIAFGMDDAGKQVPFDLGTADAADCAVRLWRLGPYLIAADNTLCGGKNASFTGVYRSVGR